MNMTTIKMNTVQIEQLKNFYQDYLKPTCPPYSLFSAVKDGTTITAYESGKVLFQGSNAQAEAQQWGTFDTNEKKQDNNLPPNFQTWSVIGSDETGTGSYFGSIVVCATYVKKEQLASLKQLGVQDSKNLSDSRIAILATQLKEIVPYSLLVVEPPKYNDIQPTMSQGKMKAILHNYALGKLLKKISPEYPDGLLIDQFELPQTYFSHIKDEPVQIKKDVYFATKGESHHLAVACASIIARYEFIENLKKLSKQAGINLPSGAGHSVDVVASQLLKKDKNALSYYAKLHFANTEKAKKLK
ncbi:ribonuclease HIII [Granulicatella sp. zg-84]|nr:ribonuclease HIII [Granulicatella sp. zg-84]